MTHIDDWQEPVPAKCQYCNQPDWTGGTTTPPLCRRHYEAVLLKSRLERQGIPVTVENAETMMARTHVPWSIMARELGLLLEEVQ